MECIRNTLDRCAQFYEDEMQKLSEQQFMPVWNFYNFFILKDLDEFKSILLIVQNDEKESFIVFMNRALPSNHQATKMAKRVYAKVEVEFSLKKRESCCKLDLRGPEANF